MSLQLSDNELHEAKLQYARAKLARRKFHPFDCTDPYKISFDAYGTNRVDLALHVVGVLRFHEMPEIDAMVEQLRREEANAIQEKDIAVSETIKTPEFKAKMRVNVMEQMQDIMENTLIDAADRIKAADRICKLMSLDEDAKGDDEHLKDRSYNVIHHELAPMDEDGYDEFAEKQQAQLQKKLAKMMPEDAKVIN